MNVYYGILVHTFSWCCFIKWLLKESLTFISQFNEEHFQGITEHCQNVFLHEYSLPQCCIELTKKICAFTVFHHFVYIMWYQLQVNTQVHKYMHNILQKSNIKHSIMQDQMLQTQLPLLSPFQLLYTSYVKRLNAK